jgi:hypothetical protein
MPDGSLNLKPDEEISGALANLRTGDWPTLVAFFDAAVNQHPSSEDRLREQLQLSEDEELDDDMQRVVTLYGKLAATGSFFQTEIRSQMLELLDDIVHHNVSTQTRYEHLQTLVENFEVYEDVDPTKIVTSDFQKKWEELKIIWAEGRPVEDAVVIRRRIVRMLTGLAEDAGKRAENATALCNALGSLRDDMSKLDEEFQTQAQVFRDKVGSENAELAALRGEVVAIRSTLKALQSRIDTAHEKVKHPPWYYFIPIVGQFIAIADLTKLSQDVQNSMRRIQDMSRKLQMRQTRKTVIEHLNSMHLGVSDDLVATSEDLHELIPVVERFELGWRAIGSDLREIVRVLGDGEGGTAMSEDFDSLDLELHLIDAKKEWEKVADTADRFRRFGTTAKNAASVDDLPWETGQ